MESESGARGKFVRIRIDKHGHAHKPHPKVSISKHGGVRFHPECDCTLIFTYGCPFGRGNRKNIRLYKDQDHCEPLRHLYAVCLPHTYPYCVQAGEPCNPDRTPPQDVVITS